MHRKTLIYIVVNVLIGLYLFGDKIANPQNISAYWVMVALVVIFGIVDGSMSTYFGFSRYYCAERTQAREEEKPETELNEISSTDNMTSPSPQPSPSKKTPSQVSATVFDIHNMVQLPLFDPHWMAVSQILLI